MANYTSDAFTFEKVSAYPRREDYPALGGRVIYGYLVFNPSDGKAMASTPVSLGCLNAQFKNGVLLDAQFSGNVMWATKTAASDMCQRPFVYNALLNTILFMGFGASGGFASGIGERFMAPVTTACSLAFAAAPTGGGVTVCNRKVGVRLVGK